MSTDDKKPAPEYPDGCFGEHCAADDDGSGGALAGLSAGPRPATQADLDAIAAGRAAMERICWLRSKN